MEEGTCGKMTEDGQVKPIVLDHLCRRIEVMNT